MSVIITGTDESKKIAEEEVLLYGPKNPWKTEIECRSVAVRGDLSSGSNIKLAGIDKGSAIQVRINTGDSTICFLIDSMTGKYLGPCLH